MSLHQRLGRTQDNALAEECLVPLRRYLFIEIINLHGEQHQAWLDIDQWLATQQHTLPGVAWSEVPLVYLAGWFQEQKTHFYIAEEFWNVVQVSVTEHRPLKNVHEVKAEPCQLLCEKSVFSEASKANHQALSKQVCFTLRVLLGISRLPLSTLCRLNAGDLLVIKHPLSMITVEHRRVFYFERNNESEIMITEPVDLTPEPLKDEASILFNWNDLPVDIEFVMPGYPLTLHEVDGIQSGTLLTLPEGVERKIAVYLNRKLLAQGELVVLDDGVLAVEVNHVGSSSLGDLV